MTRKHNVFRSTVCILAVVYLAGPVIAALFRYPDRRGPRIYPRDCHSVLFSMTYQLLHGEKPRIPADRGRPWFYGMERPVISGRWIIHMDP